jgi:seryl-tRNA synthetase
MWGITIFGLIQVWQGYWKERSLGKSVVIKMKEEHAAIKKEVEELRKEHSELSDIIDGAIARYEKLIEKMISNFPFKQ